MTRCTRLPVRRCAAMLALALGVAFAPATTAAATWAVEGSNSGAGAAATMPTGSAPSGAVVGTSVTVSWSTAELSNGTAVAGYVIERFNTSTGAQATVGAACSGTVTATSCTESAVAAGTWVYTDTPVEASWTGGASPDSAVVTVT